MVGILKISVLRSARAFFIILAEEVAGGSGGVASVRGDIATIAGRGPGTCRARKSRVYGMWTVSGGGGSMHPLRY